MHVFKVLSDNYLNDERPDIKNELLFGATNQESNLAEEFDAIVWISAKNNQLTADGIILRHQVMRTLDDIFTAIANTLQRQDITRAGPETRNNLVRQALGKQKTLLCIDNLETVSDEKVNDFLRELPAPTKALVTTRHRIDIAYAIRLTAMNWDDANKYIKQEIDRKQVILQDQEVRQLYDRTGGIPLAISWSIAQIAYGYSVSSVLRRLSLPNSDVARFCFEDIVKNIKGKNAYHLLLALSLFSDSADRLPLSFIIDIFEMDLDDSLVQLEKLSLINKQGNRFMLLPLTKLYCQEELSRENELKDLYEHKFVEYFVNLVLERKTTGKYKALEIIGPEISNILWLIDWCWKNEQYEPLIKLITGIHFYLWITGEWHIDVRNLELGKEAAQEIDWDLAKASCLILLTGTLVVQNAYEQALAYAEEARRIFLIHDDGRIFGENPNLEEDGVLTASHGLCMAIWRLGEIHMYVGNFELAQELYEQALMLTEERNDTRNLIRTLQRYGALNIKLENYGMAETMLHRARQLREKTTTISAGLSHTYSLLGQAAFYKEDWQGAQSFLKQALQMGQELGSPIDNAGPLLYLAKLHYATQEYTKARSLAEEALRISAELGLIRISDELKTLIKEIDINTTP